MTRQRYIKLLYALMQRINQKHIEVFGTPAENWGKVLKGTLRIKYRSTQNPIVTSYAEAWEMLKPIREQYGM